MRALVIGGSLGGLFAAHFMRSIGWEAIVFERNAADLAGRGVGIGTHGALAEVMQRIGFAIDARMGVGVRSAVCFDRDGSVLRETTINRTMSAWSSLYRPLRQALPDSCYRTQMVFLRAEQDERRAVAIFADGTRIAGDLLIGADGIRSSVREQFLPDLRPDYAGYVGWRALVPEAELPPAFRDTVFSRYSFCLPEAELVLGYPVPGAGDDTRPGRRNYNVLWYRPATPEALQRLCTDAAGEAHGTAIPPPLIRPEAIAALKQRARSTLAPQLAELVTRCAQPFFQAIHDFATPAMAFGRVALLGDAAFVARPHVGAGVTKAALDAACLADCLRASGGDTPAALAAYEDKQRRLGTALVARGRQLGAYLGADFGPPERRHLAAEYRRPERVMREHGAHLAYVRNAGARAPRRSPFDQLDLDYCYD